MTPGLLACSPTPSRELWGDPRFTKEAVQPCGLSKAHCFIENDSSVADFFALLSIACMPAKYRK